MKIHLEPILFTCRGWNDPASVYGDPYDLVMTVHKIGDHAEIIGLKGRLTPSGYKALKAQLRGLGVTSASWESDKRTRHRLIA